MNFASKIHLNIRFLEKYPAENRTMSRFSTVKPMWFTIFILQVSLFYSSIFVMIFINMFIYSFKFGHFLRAFFWILCAISTVVLILFSSDKLEPYLCLISTKYESFLFCKITSFFCKVTVIFFSVFFCILRLFSAQLLILIVWSMPLYMYSIIPFELSQENSDGRTLVQCI
jgi:hypothetical protein